MCLCSILPAVYHVPALFSQLHDRALQLQLAIQRMANIKEYRTPQVRGVMSVRCKCKQGSAR